MCIFYIKSLSCGCQIIASHIGREQNCIILGNHSYKCICDKCINLQDEILDNKLNNIKNDIFFNKIYCQDDFIYYSNRWTRSPSSPLHYDISDEMKAFIS